LDENTVIKSLGIVFETYDTNYTHNFQFLNKAVALTSLAISNVPVGELYHDPLYEFIATHDTLSSFTLSIFNYVGVNEFLVVYERILMAMSQNSGLSVLNFNCAVVFDDDPFFSGVEVSTLVMRVSEISRILEGRNVIINGVRVDRIINDLKDDDDTTKALQAIELFQLVLGEPVSNNGDA